MKNIIGQSAVTAIEHDSDPTITVLPNNLIEAAMKLNMFKDKYKLPYFRARATNSICHSIDFRGSLDAPETWAYGYYENSKLSFSGSIFPKQQWLGSNPSQDHLFDVTISGSRNLPAKLRSRNNLTLEQALVYIEKQLSKLAIKEARP